jgi:L-ascorbate metabolism protein UlaG (beta-lactamase superfamily)
VRSVSVTWYGQSGFRLASGEAVILIDPFLTDRPDRRYPPPATAADFADLIRESPTPATVLIPPRAHPVTLALS